jgi:hypothetical protein
MWITFTVLQCTNKEEACLLNGIYRLRVFEDRVLRRIFGPRRDGVNRGV